MTQQMKAITSNVLKPQNLVWYILAIIVVGLLSLLLWIVIDALRPSERFTQQFIKAVPEYVCPGDSINPEIPVEIIPPQGVLVTISIVDLHTKEYVPVGTEGDATIFGRSVPENLFDASGRAIPFSLEAVQPNFIVPDTVEYGKEYNLIRALLDTNPSTVNIYFKVKTQQECN